MKVGKEFCVDGAQALVINGQHRGMSGRIALFFPGPSPLQDLVLICVKDEPFHQHRFVPVSCVGVLEEGER